MLAGAALLRLLLAALVPLFPDESYYWEWSRRLAGGYFDHPYLISFVIRVGEWPFSMLGVAPAPITVRFGAIVAGTVAAFATVAIARRLAGDRAALVAAILVSVIPLAATGLVLATPDAPLLAAAAVTLYLLVRALESPTRSAESLRWWCAAGLTLGLALSSKYTAVLLPAGVLVAMLARRDLRMRLGEPGPYLAIILALVVFLPVVRWNAGNEMISFAFQLEHGLGRPSGSVINRLLEYLGGQLGLASPILFLLMCVAVWRSLRERDPVRGLLGIVTLFIVLFFSYSAMRKRVEPNWPALAYIPAVALLATVRWSDVAGGERWRRRGWLLAATLTGLVYLHALSSLFAVRADRDPVARAHGWDHLADRVIAARDRVAGEGGARVHVGADRYQDAASLAFQLARREGRSAMHQPTMGTITYSMNLSGRSNQYDYWPRFRDRARAGDDLVLALDDTPDVPSTMHGTAAALAPYFGRVERGERVELRRADGVQTVRRIYLLRGWNGHWPN